MGRVRQYPSPAAFRAAIDTRLRNYARGAGVPVQVVRRQAALSAGADVFISKGDAPERVAERLQSAAESIRT